MNLGRMVSRCPRCRQQNRLPDTLRPGGAPRCARCGLTLLRFSEEAAPDAPGSGTGPAPGRAPATLAARAGAGLAAYVAGMGREGRRRPLLAALCAAYAALVLTLALSDAVGPESWWPGSLNLYLPQWLWAAPASALLPLSLWRARRWAWVPALGLAWVLGPGMGLCVHAPAPPPGSAAALPPPGPAVGPRLRVMTYNVKWGRHDPAAIAADIRAFRPDLIQMQDSAGALAGPVGRALQGWSVRVSGQYLVARPGPLPALESRDISFGYGEHHCVRYELPVGGRAVAVYDVHLLSPRWGLRAARRRQFGGLEGNAAARLAQAARLAGYVGAERMPVLVTGDLNAPPPSLVLRGLCGAGLRDAFSEAGLGYGYTYGAFTRVGASYVRIDHILVSREWRVARCWVGNARGSEHRPVVADLVLAGGGGASGEETGRGAANGEANAREGVVP